MNIKTILAMLALVGIGFVAGFYTHRAASKKVIHKVAKLREAPGFEAHFYRILKPDAEQKEQIAPIVSAYAKKVAAIHDATRKNKHMLMDSMHAAIKPYLEEEQIERMEKFSRRFPPPHPGKRKKMKKKHDHWEKEKR
jgi:hypothetical protein